MKKSKQKYFGHPDVGDLSYYRW